MALELRDINPTILGGVVYKESPIFLDNRGHLKEFIETQLDILCKEKLKKCEFGVSISDDNIVFYLEEKNSKKLLLVMDESRINFEEMKATDFYFFNECIPILLNSILEHIKRKNLKVLGMMFKKDVLPLKKDVNAVSAMKNRYFSFKEELSELKIKEQDIDRLGFELKFIQNSCLRNLIFKVNKREENTLLINFDTRFDSAVFHKELEIKDANTISDFFKKQTLDYFLDCIVNGIAKDIFELSLKKDAKK